MAKFWKSGGSEAPSGAKATATAAPPRPPRGPSGGARPARPSSAGVSAAERELGEHLVQLELLSRDQLDRLLAARTADPQSRLEILLVERGAVRGPDLVRILAERSGLPVADLSTRTPDRQVLQRLPEDVVRSLRVVPLGLVGNQLEVAVADLSSETRNQITQLAKGSVRFLLAPADEITMAISRAYRADGEIDRWIQAFEAGDGPKGGTARVVEDMESDDAPVVQVVNRIVAQALRDRTSDVHLEPMDGTVRVRFRIDGTLKDAFELPAGISQALISRLKIMSGMNIVERRRPQDGQFTMAVDGREVDVRVATVATVFGEKCVLRLLDKSRSMLAMGQLGMPPDTYELYGSLVHSPFGMVLCAGPTGSGKTTTLYATLHEVNSGGKNIMTIEDPVEYVYPGINQIQTNEQAGLTFASGLKAILRQDPDVILVGEIRDADTARIAIQSALTGHFVLSSLHGTDAVAALHRFLDMGIESFLIASSVLGVVGQRLLRRICDRCKQAYVPSPEELAFYEEHGGAPKDVFYEGTGCNFCAGTGYLDRIGVYEVLRVTPEIRRLIVGWATQEELRRLAIAQGMRPLTDEALRLVEQDMTTIPEVIRTIYSA